MSKKVFENESFYKLSLKARLLLMASFNSEKCISNNKNHNFLAKFIDVDLPAEDFLFEVIIGEIRLSGIKYQLEKIKFIAPTVDDCINFLTTIEKRLKKTLSFAQKKAISEYFINYYESKNWKLGKNKVQITSWRHALMKAADNWQIVVSDKNDSIDVIMSAFAEFNNF